MDRGDGPGTRIPKMLLNTRTVPCRLQRKDISKVEVQMTAVLVYIDHPYVNGSALCKHRELWVLQYVRVRNKVTQAKLKED